MTELVETSPKGKKDVVLKARRAVAAPIYLVAIVLVWVGELLGLLAAKVAGDPR